MVQLWELEYYDVISERMILEDGTYQFMAGASSQDIRLEQSIEIDGTHAGKEIRSRQLLPTVMMHMTTCFYIGESTVHPV